MQTNRIYLCSVYTKRPLYGKALDIGQTNFFSYPYIVTYVQRLRYHLIPNLGYLTECYPSTYKNFKIYDLTKI